MMISIIIGSIAIAAGIPGETTKGGCVVVRSRIWTR